MMQQRNMKDDFFASAFHPPKGHPVQQYNVGKIDSETRILGV